MVQLALALLISILCLIGVSRYLKLHPFFGLLLSATVFGLIMGQSGSEILDHMQNGFGNLLQQIGFLVAIGSCLGMVMEKTGAMTTVAHKIMGAFGASRSPFAMTLIGVLVGIPVFCDSGFIILSRLVPAIASASATPAQLSLALATGLYTTHTLVPPTPGPLAAAANLGMGANLAHVMLIGLFGTLPVAAVAFLLSKRIGLTIKVQRIESDTNHFPEQHAGLSFLPLVVPILLIAIGSLPALHNVALVKLISNPSIALLIGLLISLLLIRGAQKKEWPGWMTEALRDAGIILLITGAGGAFGTVIKSSGVDSVLNELISDTQAGGTMFLMMGWCLAAILKTAQGSSTSAIIITSSLLAPLTLAAGLTQPIDLAILILAIGGGAMTVSHANDSYFWVVSQFSGIRERDAYASFTLVTLAQGVTALITALALYYIL